MTKFFSKIFGLLACLPCILHTEEPILNLVNIKPQDQIFYLDSMGYDWIYISQNPDDPIYFKYHGHRRRFDARPDPNNTLFRWASNESLWALAIEKTDENDRAALYQCNISEIAPEWRRVGTVEEYGFNIPSFLYPINENRFLGFYPFRYITDPVTQKASFLSIYKKEKDRIVFDHIVDIDIESLGGRFESKKYHLNENIPELTCIELNPSHFSPSLLIPSCSNRFLAITSTASGMIWIFDLEKSSLRRTFNLYALKKEDFSKLGLIDHLILGTGFDPSGRLIVAGRHPDLVRHSIELASNPKDSDRSSTNLKDFQFISNFYHEISWFILDPETGSIENRVGYPDFPEKTPGYRWQRSFLFVVTPSGSVQTNAFKNWEKVKGAWIIPSMPSAPPPAKPNEPAPAPRPSEATQAPAKGADPR